MKRPSSHLYFGILSLITFSHITHAELRAPLQDDQMTNGQKTLAPLKTLQDLIVRSTATLLDKNGKVISTITWVGEEGYFITKASEAPRLEECLVKHGNNQKAAVREIRRDTRHDLVLAQAVHVKGVSALPFISSKNLTFGQWIAAPANAKELKIGVISAKRRAIKGFGAAIGVRMDDKAPDKLIGVRIIGVAEDSPAATAGLRANDIMLELAGESVREFRRVNEIISTRQPGEEIEVKFTREGEEKRLFVRLASRTKVLSNWEGEDFANGGISIRTDNFAEVLQHDLPLHPSDMGGPVLDLKGRAVGINIARVDRVTTFALPAEIFWPLIQQWIKADRHPPKALPAESLSTEGSAPKPPEPS